MVKTLLTVLQIVLVSVITLGQEISVIPKPFSLEKNSEGFLLDEGCAIQFDSSNEEVSSIADLLTEYISNDYGLDLIRNNSKKKIILKIDNKINLGEEGYKFCVGKNQILITAKHPVGIFYGTQTLKQLIPVGSKELLIPGVSIEDQPRFKWRGCMLDVGRHFFPVSFIKKYIDILAMYKLNTFHWHLTEDQGWRIEIKKYPRLTEIAHWRDETIKDNAKNNEDPEGYDGIGYGGFYTQEQIKDLVKYAADRFITIVPEIEMPGHSSAALAAFPGLGCTGGPYHVQKHWGVFKEVYCAGKEDTFVFLQNVLDEVCDLFPSAFIHIGGDECPKEAWKKCPDCQKRIEDEELADEHELQSNFISRMDTYLSNKGRRLIGWDEILEGGLAPKATVMSWRGVEGGIAAAKVKHDVVMTPLSHLYFDYSQLDRNEPGFNSLREVYSYEPIPEELTKDESKYILGAQANLWTEKISSIERAEYMLLPRLAALSELVWTPENEKNYDEFLKRLEVDYKRLDRMGINYRNHHID